MFGYSVVKLTLVAGFVCLFAGCASVPSSRLKTADLQHIRSVAVLPFTDAPGADAGNSGRIVSGAVGAEALGIPYWRLIDQSHLHSLLGKTNLSRASSEDLMRIGQSLGVDAIITGNVSQYEIGSIPFLFFFVFDKNVYRVSYSMRMINVRSGEVCWAGSATGTSLKSLEDSSLLASRELFAKIGLIDPLADPSESNGSHVQPSINASALSALPPRKVIGQKYALLIGINQYSDPDIIPLAYAEKDVLALNSVLVSSAGYQEENVFMLISSAKNLAERPTRNNILMTLKWLSSNLKPEDSLLMLFCGHGDMVQSDNYLIPMDGKKALLEDTAIRFSRIFEWLDQCPAGSQVVCLDACHSGGLARNQRGARGMQVVSTSMGEELEKYSASGRAVLTSCSKDEVSYEDHELEHGVFSYYMVDGLSSAVADNNGDKVVTVYELGHYIREHVSDWCKIQRKVPSQTPRLRFNDLSGEITLVGFK